MQQKLGIGWIIGVVVLAIVVIGAVFVFAGKPAEQAAQQKQKADSYSQPKPEQPFIPKAQ